MKRRQIELDGIDLLLLTLVAILLVCLSIMLLPPLHIPFHAYWFSWQWWRGWYVSKWWDRAWIAWVVVGCLVAVTTWVAWLRNRQG
jgi:hypothetical protein